MYTAVNPVIWLLDRERDVPEWFALNNVAVRSIVIPLPDTGHRPAASAARSSIGCEPSHAAAST